MIAMAAPSEWSDMPIFAQYIITLSKHISIIRQEIKNSKNKLHLKLSSSVQSCALSCSGS